MTDGEGGAAWAGAEDGSEALVLLPSFIASHWSTANLGIVGIHPPRLLYFHATNAPDKELALKANGFWYWHAANLARPKESKSVERSIFVDGARPRVIAFAPHAPLSTPDPRTHMEEVVKPLLLAARLTGRLAALPALNCSETPWRTADVTTASISAASIASASHHRPACRTGACSHRMAATGATSSAEASAGTHLATSLHYVSPFAQDAAAERIGLAPLTCTPFERIFGTAPLSDERCLSGGSAPLLHAPAWAEYSRLLQREGLMTRSSQVALRSRGHPPPRGAVETLEYASFARAVRELDKAREDLLVLFLPGRVALSHLPVEAQREFEQFCALGAAASKSR